MTRLPDEESRRIGHECEELAHEIWEVCDGHDSEGSVIKCMALLMNVQMEIHKFEHQKQLINVFILCAITRLAAMVKLDEGEDWPDPGSGINSFSNK
jgi:hypothetical protein